MMSWLTLENLKIAGAVSVIALLCAFLGGCMIGCGMSRGSTVMVCPVTSNPKCPCGCPQGDKCSCARR